MVFRRNDELATARERIRDSYRALLAWKPVKDDGEILTLVEAALRNAAEAKNIV
jgi:hypothetical protein